MFICRAAMKSTSTGATRCCICTMVKIASMPLSTIALPAPWQADLAADLLIRQGLMQECLIVGVSNGREDSLLEYLPPYSRHFPPPRRPHAAPDGQTDEGPPVRRPLEPVPGHANRTLAYYRDEIARYIGRHYRTLSSREHTATCGSSFGGLFSFYIAWEHSEFARGHAALSSSFWATRNAAGELEAIERIRSHPRRIPPLAGLRQVQLARPRR